MKNTQKGFTLVELLVVIAILAILAGVGVAGYSAFIGRAEESNVETEANQIATAIKSFTIAGQSYKIGTTVVEKTGDNPATADTVETKYNVTENVVVNADGTLSHNAAAEIEEIADFASLPGELSIVGGKLIYTSGDYSKEIATK